MEPDDEIMQAFTVVFEGLEHLGPGDAETTAAVVNRLKPDLPGTPRVADLGCGVGSSALVLTKRLPEARVLAVDSHAPFIDRLQVEAKKRELTDHLHAVVGDMANPPPLDGVAAHFDLIWSESAIYSIGRSRAISLWHSFLNPNGWLAFSDIVWQRPPEERSSEASDFWAAEYPEIATAATILDELQTAGYAPLDPVSSPPRAWSNYYDPLRERLRELKGGDGRSQALDEVIESFEKEIAIYDNAGSEVALTFFMAQRDVE